MEMKILNKVFNILKGKKENLDNNTPKLNSFKIPDFGNVSEDEKKTLILVHKVDVAHYSKQHAHECLKDYFEYNVKPLEKANISIHNIIIPITDSINSKDFGVEAIYPYMVDVYPTIKYLLDEFDGFQTKTQERKMKIDSVLKS